MEFFRQTNYNFIGIRKYTYIFSAAVTLISLILILFVGLHYGIDFTGGTSLELKFANPVSIGDVRSAVGNAGFNDSEIKQIGPK